MQLPLVLRLMLLAPPGNALPLNSDRQCSGVHLLHRTTRCQNSNACKSVTANASAVNSDVGIHAGYDEIQLLSTWFPDQGPCSAGWW